MLKRRSFLASILAAGVAPAFVGSGVLMPVKRILVPQQALIPMEIGRFESFRIIESPADAFGQRGFIKADIRPGKVNMNANWMRISGYERYDGKPLSWNGKKYVARRYA